MDRSAEQVDPNPPGANRTALTQIRVIIEQRDTNSGGESVRTVCVDCGGTIEQVPDSTGEDEPLTQGEEKIIQEGDTIEVQLSEHINKLEIPKDGENDSSSLKRKSSAPHELDNNSKKMNTEEANESPSEQENKNLAEGTWEELESLIIFTSKGVISREKIASFDLDDTLITTISGNSIPKNRLDWKILFSETPDKIKECFNNGFKIVIFTNQGGIGIGKIKLQDFKWRIERIVHDLGVPIQVFAATKQDKYRKPILGMWEYLVEKKNDGIEIDTFQSFYCGDAAGRPENSTDFRKKRDQSSLDRLFAINIDCLFYTPEEYFQNLTENYFNSPYFAPSRIMSFLPVFPPNISLKPKTQEIAIMVGSPGSGKSTFVEKYLLDVGYVHISRDDSGTPLVPHKCTSMASEVLKKDNTKSVIIDNMNADVETRKRYIDLARQMKLKIRAFSMTTTQPHANHNNKFRQLTTGKDIPASVVMNNYFARFTEPMRKEGFYEVVKVNFIPKFDNPEEERLYNMYLLDR